MTTVADILNYIESIAPPYMAESWDNVGLLCVRGRHLTTVLQRIDKVPGARYRGPYTDEQVLHGRLRSLGILDLNDDFIRFLISSCLDHVFARCVEPLGFGLIDRSRLPRQLFGRGKGLPRLVGIPYALGTT